MARKGPRWRRVESAATNMLAVCQKRRQSPMSTQALLSLNIVRRRPESVESDMATGRVYVLRDPEGVSRYVGKNESTLAGRMDLNRWVLRTDWTCSPLYRYVHDHCGGSFDGWTIDEIASVRFDRRLLPNALVDYEDLCMRAMRNGGYPLLNKNRARCESRDCREYMRQWRARNPDYMAKKSREHRERRRVAALMVKAEELAREVDAG